MPHHKSEIHECVTETTVMTKSPIKGNTLIEPAAGCRMVALMICQRPSTTKRFCSGFCR